MPDAQDHPDGASLLADAAVQVLGGPGAVVFGLIVVLACLTTSVGLIGATSEFFHKLVPALSYRVWAILFTIIAFLVSTAGLETVLAIAGPIVGFLYPAGITLILLTLIEPLTRRRLNLTFRLALVVAIIWAALMTLSSLGVAAGPIESLIGWTPLHEQGMGWVAPTVAAAVVGFIVDLARGASDPVPVGGESQEAAQERVDASS
jgi:LIVCS family branched-chain amino acid:cation transporter